MNATYMEEQTDLIAEQLLALLGSSETNATVLALQGDLGAGKTTLTKSIAEKLGIAETVISPTFVIAKFYEPLRDLPPPLKLWRAKQDLGLFEHVVHIDAYRIESLNELVPLGWENILQQPKTLVIVEWPERIREALPHDTRYFRISHEGDRRTIKQM
jgi:tRNA threonylcarbamoyladenosine biosynthesis protein TsaE